MSAQGHKREKACVPASVPVCGVERAPQLQPIVTADAGEL
jgi:hypothetical protein